MFFTFYDSKLEKNSVVENCVKSLICKIFCLIETGTFSKAKWKLVAYCRWNFSWLSMGSSEGCFISFSNIFLFICREKMFSETKDSFCSFIDSFFLKYGRDHWTLHILSINFWPRVTFLQVLFFNIIDLLSAFMKFSVYDFTLFFFKISFFPRLGVISLFQLFLKIAVFFRREK